MSAITRQQAQDDIDHLLRAADEPLHSVFVTRSLEALARMTDGMDGAALREVVSAPSDREVLIRALELTDLDTDTAREEQEADRRLERARLRGLADRRALLEAEGGTLSAEEVAEHLQLTRQGVDYRRRTGHLIGLRLGRRGYAYPAWQLAPEGTLAGLEDALSALQDHDPWTQMIFFLSSNTWLEGATPLSELRHGNLDAVVHAAAAYGEHGAS